MNKLAVKFYVPTNSLDNEKIKLVENYRRVDARKHLVCEHSTGLTGSNKSDYLYEVIILFIMMKIDRCTDDIYKHVYLDYIERIHKLLKDISLADRMISNFSNDDTVECQSFLNEIVKESKDISIWCVEEGLFENE